MAAAASDSSLRTLLLYGQVYDYAASSGERGKSKSKIDIAKALLTPEFLSIVREEEIESREVKEVYARAVEICRRRLVHLVDNVQKKRIFCSNPESRNEVFLDLNDFPSLICDEEGSLQLSQSTTCSVRPSSQRSDIELEIPSSQVGPEDMETDSQDLDAHEMDVEVSPVHSRKRKACADDGGDVSGGKGPYKEWVDLSDQGKRDATKEIYAKLQEVASAYKIEPHELAAYLGRRSSYQAGHREVSVYFDCILKGEPSSSEVDVASALFLKTTLLKIGRGPYTEMKLMFEKTGTFLPARKKLEAELGTVVPKREGLWHGIVVKFSESLAITIKRALRSSISLTENVDNMRNHGLVARAVGGIDGSGKHSEYNSASSLAKGVDTSHFLYAGFTLLDLRIADQERTIIYEDLRPGSPEAERPLMIIPGKESSENFAKVLQRLTEEVEEAMRTPFVVHSPEFGDVMVTLSFDLSQLDGKALAEGSGQRGSYCTCCTVSADDAKDVSKIKNGFPIDKSIESLQDLFDMLNDEQEGISTFGGDFLKKIKSSERYGLTHQPLTTLDIVRHFPITHSYIRSLSFFETLFYRINGGCRQMGKGKRLDKVQKAGLKLAKDTFRKEAKETLHMKLDCPDAYGAGGSSDTAQLARRFFWEENVEKIVGLLTSGTWKEKDALRVLHRNFSVILRVVSSKEHLIDVDAFESLCKETNILIAEEFEFSTIPQSIHRLLGHSAERIRVNDGYGLGKLSEESLEAQHKLLRTAREILASKDSLEHNLFDVFTFLYTRSDPIVRSKRRTLHCSVCSKQGHTKRSCPTRKVGVISSYNAMFEDLLLPN